MSERTSRTEIIRLSPRPGEIYDRPRSADRLRGPGRQKAYIKRLIACCDGTWLDSDNGMVNGRRQVESNVTRIARATLPEAFDGIQQIVYYHKGVASQGGLVDRTIMGAVGEGLNQNVREAYAFIANNYERGDEIILIGFSRGAFTARTVAGLISGIGVLTKKGLSYLPEIYKDVLHRRDRRYRSKYPDVPFPNKPSANNPRYVEELQRRGLTKMNVPIKAVGVWDTVGSLGIPRVGILQNLGLQRDESREMAFYDTKLPDGLENAFQALALDETRNSFAPAVWEKPPGNRTRLRQVWFPGVHSNVGGGYDDQELSNITLAWMMSQLSPFMDFDKDYILDEAEANEDYYHDRRKKVRPWSFGLIKNSMAGLYALGGGKPRTPGEYFVNAPDGGETEEPLHETHEYIHPSVRTRFVLRGPGREDDGDYEPKALDDWKLIVEYPDGPDGKPDVYWKAKFRDNNVSTRILPEAPLWEFERALLRLSPDMEDEVLHPPPTRRRKR